MRKLRIMGVQIFVQFVMLGIALQRLFIHRCVPVYLTILVDVLTETLENSYV